VGFFSPWFLGGLLAAGLPLWVHLLRQHRSTPRPFASLMFFERRTQSSVKHRRLKHYALLALRLAMIVLLALLFAEPFVRRAVPAASGRRLTLIAVDHSFSMRYGDHLERAKREALRTIAALGGGDLGQVAALGDRVELLTQAVGDRAALEAAVRSIQPGDSTSSFAEFARFLRSLPNSAGMPVEAHLFSDVQKSAMPANFADLALADRVTLAVHAVTDRDPGNWVVESVTAPDRVFGPAKPRIQATIAGLGTKPARRTVTLMMNGRPVDSKPVETPENGRAQVEFANVDVPYGVNRGEVRIDGDDALQQDNRFYFSIERADPSKVLYIYDSRQTPAYFRAALEAGGESAFTLDAASTEQAAHLGLSKYAYVVLAGAGAMPQTLELNLRQFVNAGGGLLVALSPATMSSGRVPVIDVRIDGARYSTREGDRFQTAMDVDTTHPALDRSEGFGGVKFFYAAKVEPGQDRILAKLSDGTPLLLEHRLGEGRVLVFSSSFDNVTNDLPLHPLFVPFVEHVSKYLEGGELMQSNVTVGTAIELRKSKDRGAAAEVLAPDGKRALSLQDAASALAYVADREGFYDVRTASGRRELVAVNADRRESDLTPIPDETLALWKGTSGAPQSAQAGGTGEADSVPHSLWKYVLIALLAVSLAESWLADRFTPAAREERAEQLRKQAA
jgi:hypothetical protein